jgi:hypothetical protein
VFHYASSPVFCQGGLSTCFAVPGVWSSELFSAVVTQCDQSYGVIKLLVYRMQRCPLCFRCMRKQLAAAALFDGVVAIQPRNV